MCNAECKIRLNFVFKTSVKNHFIFLMSRSQQVPPKMDEETLQRIRNIKLTAEYRKALTPYQRVCILNNSENEISIKTACREERISTKTYYKIKKSQDTLPKKLEKQPPHSSLTKSEENLLIDEIGKAQLNCNCLSGKDVRELAQKMYSERTLLDRDFSRGWYHLFLERHAEELGKIKCDSVDENRGSISLAEVNEYIKAVNNALPLITDLRLLLNMDESGFGRRPDYKKRRTCVYRKSVNIPPLWRAATDNYHVSWVCCVTAAATHLRHLFITTRKRMDPEFKNTFLSNFGDFEWALKGYMVESNVIYWVREILIPYVIQTRMDINNENHPVVLIVDNLHQHLTSDVKEEFEKIKPFILIPLPAHSSHITQPCDSCVFSSVKRRYSNLNNPDSDSKFTTKLLKIKNAIQQSLNEEVIVSFWKHCGFNIVIEDGICKSVSFSAEFQEKLRSIASQKNTEDSNETEQINTEEEE